MGSVVASSAEFKVRTKGLGFAAPTAVGSLRTATPGAKSGGHQAAKDGDRRRAPVAVNGFSGRSCRFGRHAPNGIRTRAAALKEEALGPICRGF